MTCSFQWMYVASCVPAFLSFSLSHSFSVCRSVFVSVSVRSFFLLHLGSQKPLHLLWEINLHTVWRRQRRRRRTKKFHPKMLCLINSHLMGLRECVRRLSFCVFHLNHSSDFSVNLIHTHSQCAVFAHFYCTHTVFISFVQCVFCVCEMLFLSSFHNFITTL